MPLDKLEILQATESFTPANELEHVKVDLLLRDSADEVSDPIHHYVFMTDEEKAEYKSAPSDVGKRAVIQATAARGAKEKVAALAYELQNTPPAPAVVNVPEEDAILDIPSE